jgi:SpoVK/Ycf46/Vps4 family AAA+-type ATPase
LPAQTRRTLEQALAQVRNHTLIYRSWGLGERHTSGRGLTFNFAGPPGTGKTICAEAVANAVGMKLLVVDYAEAESMWVGETPKNIAGIFRAAAEQNAVLFFDEADAIATRRSTGGALPYDREMNLTVNVLLRELEAFNGIVIFATNLAANFDPAFERRIRTHVLFEMPGPEDRTQIWQLQIHPKKTPLASDVDFKRLAERYAVSGGDIKNAVLKAASAAAAEPGPDMEKRIGQQHFESAMDEVISAKAIMQQSLFIDAIAAPDPIAVVQNREMRWNAPAVAAVVLAVVALLASFLAVALVYLR